MYRQFSVRIVMPAVLIVAAVMIQTVDGVARSGPPPVRHEDRIAMAVVHLQTKEQMRQIGELGLDILDACGGSAVEDGHVSIFAAPAEISRLRALGFEVEVRIANWYEHYAARAKAAGTRSMGGFRTYGEIVAKLDSIHLAYPSITTAKFSLGFSVEGNFIWAIKISDNPDIDETGEPEVLFNSLTHAREPMGAEVLLQLMDSLGAGYGVDTFLTRMVDEREIWFVPCINPDGYLHNQSTDPGGGGMWRKNRALNPDLSIGVDLNRNWAYQWGLDDIGSSPDPSAPTYRGSGPFSEPELWGVRDLVNTREFVFCLNYHAYSDLYLWPWGTSGYTPDHALFQAIGDSMATFNGYTPQVGWELYPTNGAADDWMYAGTGHAKILSYTPEVGSWGEGGFWPFLSEIPAQLAENLHTNYVILDLADNPARILPPAAPLWVSGDADTSFYTLEWTEIDNGNPAVAYWLDEMVDPSDLTAGAEIDGEELDRSPAFERSTTRAYDGIYSFFGGRQNNLFSTMTTVASRYIAAGDTARFRAWYDIEDDWDYAYFDVSTDGGTTFTPIAGNITTASNPHGNNRGHGITGSSGGQFVLAEFPLDAYVGQFVSMRISYKTDGLVLDSGIYVDQFAPVVSWAAVNSLASGVPDTSFDVTGQSIGNHYYRVRSNDAEGQSGGWSHTKVNVDYRAMMLGDLNDDREITVLDVVYEIDYVFRSGPPPVYEGAGNVNGDTDTDVLDAVYLIDYVFRSGPPPIE